MPAPYSRDLRERLLRAHDAGLSQAEIARMFGVSVRTQARWRARRRQGDDLAPRPIPGRPRRLSSAQEAQLVAQVAQQPDVTLAEHRDRFATEQSIVLSIWTVGRILRHGLPLKKRA